MERYFVVDVFTDTPLEGNQLAVFTDSQALRAEHMQRLAREMNFSESVFILPARGAADAAVRIFTPRRELPFAGHPVLGTAFVVGASLDRDTVRLETGLGLTPIELERENGRIRFGRMRQAIPKWRAYEREAELLAALGVKRSGLPVEAYPNGPLHVYVELESIDAVSRLEPDFTALAELGEIGANCFSGAGADWRTRMFAPGMGVFEDPATGSAAGPLAIHLVRHGRIAFGQEIEIHQGAELGRPSVLYARVQGSGEKIDRVEVGGSAVIVAEGEFRLPPPP
jgi:trans-2,3-dihydro-3-hydroxyanthranilate isomerase